MFDMDRWLSRAADPDDPFPNDPYLDGMEASPRPRRPAGVSERDPVGIGSTPRQADWIDPSLDRRYQGQQPYDVTDAEGLDRTNDSLFNADGADHSRAGDAAGDTRLPASPGPWRGWDGRGAQPFNDPVAPPMQMQRAPFAPDDDPGVDESNPAWGQPRRVPDPGYRHPGMTQPVDRGDAPDSLAPPAPAYDRDGVPRPRGDMQRPGPSDTYEHWIDYQQQHPSIRVQRAPSLPPSVAARWQQRVRAPMTAEDVEQLRMLGVIA